MDNDNMNGLWQEYVEMYNRTVRTACEGLAALPSNSEFVIGLLKAIAGLLEATVCKGVTIDLDQLNKIYDLHPWTTHAACYVVLDIVDQTAPTHPPSFGAIFEVANFAVLSSGNDQLVDRACTMAEGYIDGKHWGEFQEYPAGTAERFSRVIRRWENHSHERLRDTATRLRSSFGHPDSYAVTTIGEDNTHGTVPEDNPALRVDEVAQVVFVDGVRVNLTPKEWALLTLLHGQPGIPMSADTIASTIGTRAKVSPEAAVSAVVHRLRVKLGAKAGVIQTRSGIGWCYQPLA